ncbi:MAG: ferredoxin--NADP reductase [Gammaproteobacteria bacterium]|jgi:ferredoxin--NADP+ reductase|nr:ferredoxin--NADP reductase [Gammaproteobacteria bacterium]
MKWVEGKVVGQNEWSPGLYSLLVQAPILPFVAGQFTQIAVDQNDTKLFRPYSFLNAPHESNLEFYFTLVKNGQLTPLLANLSLGDKIWVAEKASGRFVLSEVPDAQILWLFATGTGLGVFLSLLKTNEPWLRFSHIVLVHSVRYSSELTHQLQIETWLEQYPKQFHWVPIVTRELSSSTLGMRLTDLLLTGRLEELTSLSLEMKSSQVMLCGNPSMVTETTALLQNRGLQLNKPKYPGHISVENYWKLS